MQVIQEFCGGILMGLGDNNKIIVCIFKEGKMQITINLYIFNKQSFWAFCVLLL